MACGTENGGASLNPTLSMIFGVDTGENLEPTSILHPTFSVYLLISMFCRHGADFLSSTPIRIPLDSFQ
jgi:hypothetical protein